MIATRRHQTTKIYLMNRAGHQIPLPVRPNSTAIPQEPQGPPDKQWRLCAYGRSGRLQDRFLFRRWRFQENTDQSCSTTVHGGMRPLLALRTAYRFTLRAHGQSRRRRHSRNGALKSSTRAQYRNARARKTWPRSKSSGSIIHKTIARIQGWIFHPPDFRSAKKHPLVLTFTAASQIMATSFDFEKNRSGDPRATWFFI